MKTEYRKSNVHGLEILIINVGESECHIAPEWGANLLYFGHKKSTVIGYDEKALEKREYTGMPVLFPTPNRVRDAVAIFNGVPIRQQKNQKDIFCHGLVYDEPFEVKKINVDEEGIRVKLGYSFYPEHSYYSSFPFSCELLLEYILREGNLTVNYSVKNNGESKIPFGFGLHPYFYYSKDITLYLPAENYLLCDENNLPLGKVLKTADRFSDLNKGGASMKVTELDCDFLREKGKNAVLTYPENGRQVGIIASEDFCHYMVYSPKKENFVCVEPQTCSIDAHNLFEKGFPHSNLRFVSPGETERGYVSFVVK